MTENSSNKISSGDKLSSYGGNLTLHQDGEGRGKRVKSSSAILTGNRVSLHYIRDTGTSISLAEKDWVRIDNGALLPATKEDMLRVLSDIQVKRDDDVYSGSIFMSYRYFTFGPQLRLT